MATVFVNPERCIGCRQCEVACAVEHSVSQDVSRSFLESPTPRTRIHVEAGSVPTTSFPNKCRHCDPAPCERVCPTAAITRDPQLGLVLTDTTRCIGCAMCAVVCPFDVITFHPAVGGFTAQTAVSVKCDGCVSRVRRGEQPACVEVCKVGALVFGDINDLVASGRLRESSAVLAAADTAPASARNDAAVAGWRAFGHDLFTARVAALDIDPIGSDGDGRSTKFEMEQEGAS